MAADLIAFPIETAGIAEPGVPEQIVAVLPDATPSAAGKMSAADKTKLNSVATSATANAADAALRDRATHTGTQTASTISDFIAAVRAQVEAALIAGSNVTITPAGSGASRTLLLAAAGGGGGGGSGTVTSVGLSVPTGLEIAGSPVTAADTLAITFAAGYGIPTTAKQTQWDTAFSQTRQWNGSATGLVAATGRTSLELGSLATLSALGSITSAGAIGSTANLPIITTTGGALAVGSFGTGANTFCQGNDSRLSDARTPTAHNQAWSTITATPTTLTDYGIADAQPLDSDLTSIAALTTTSYGRSQLTLADAAADTAQLNNFTTSLKGLVPAPVTATGRVLSDSGAWVVLGGGGDALVANPLSQFAATTSAQLLATISDPTGTGLLVFGTAPTITLPNATGLPLSTGVTGILPTANGGTGVDNSTGGTANQFWARPNGATGAATYRAIVAADIPTLNQSTTGGAATLTTTRTIGGSNFNGSANVTSFPAPGAIGGTTPSSGVFTTLEARSATSLLLGVAGTAVGSVGFRNATSGTITIAPPTGALGTVTQTLQAVAGTIPVRIATGTAAMGTTAIASGASAIVVTVAAAGVATTDTINWGFNTNPNAVTGYDAAAVAGSLVITAYPTAGNVNFLVSNPTTASITPGALTLNWKVMR